MNPEVWNKLNVKTANLSGAGCSSFTREELIQASQGIPDYKTAYIEYHQNNDLKQRAKVYRGLFNEASRIPEIRDWLKSSKKHRARFGLMIDMASRELGYRSDLKKHHRQRFNDHQRAEFISVSVSTWYRGYSQIYSRIMMIPSFWIVDVMRVISIRLSG